MGLSDLEQAAVSRLVHCAVDRGLTSIDTAPLYGAGRCEEVVGRAIADRRSLVQIFSKCGLRWDDEYGAPMFQMPSDGTLRWVRKDSRRTSLARGIDESLRRLRVEAIDLLQIHQLDLDTRLADSLDELERAKNAGKILAIGVSNFPLRETEAAHRSLRDGLFSVQNELNLINGHQSDVTRNFCQRSGIRFLAYSPLARGILAGKYLAGSASRAAVDLGVGAQNLEKIHSVLRTIALPIAAAAGATLGQTCLAWALAQPGVTSVVAGATSERQIEDNARAAELHLPPEAVSRLSSAIVASRLDPMPGASRAARLLDRARRAKQIGGRLLRRLAGN
jgi:aryl-alcohol dehydrogenase-like predicted oxidoreductase